MTGIAKHIALLFCLGFAASSAFAQSQDEIKAQLAQATALQEKGAFSEARKIYESVLPALRAKGPGKDLGDALTGLAQITNAEGHYETAVALARESADVFHQLGDKDGEARAHNDAGWAYTNAGNYPEATSELDLALALNSQTPNTKTAVSILNNLGIVYYYQARYSESFHAYETAMQRLDRASDEPWAANRRQGTLLNLATLYQRLGNDQRALATYLELKQTPGLPHRTVGHLDANLGVLYRRLGDPQKALKAYREAEQAYVFEKDVDGELGVTKNIGIVLALDLGRLDQALQTFTQARTLAQKSGNQREAMQALLYRAQTLYRMGRALDAKKEFQSALAEAGKLGTVEEQWKAMFALGKIAEDEKQPSPAETQYREAIAKIESVRSRIQFTQLKSGFLADKRDVYDAMINLLLLRNDTAAAFDYMERSRARVFQDRFFEGKYSSGSGSLKSIQARLDNSTALIEFWVGPEEIAAVWITRDLSGIARRQLSPDEMEELSRTVAQLPDSLTDNWQNGFAKIAAFLPRDIAPLSNHGYPHILIVPDGFLSLLPLELVATASGKSLVEDHDLTYLPSAVLLLRHAPTRSEQLRFPWQRQLVAFGDPIVTSGTGDSLVASNRQAPLEELPGSAEEIRNVAAMSTGRTMIFLGTNDRTQNFFATSGMNVAMLHVSTHAIADLDNPELSRLLFSPDDAGQPGTYVFLKELYDIDLRGVSLATLSACDTEQGRLVPGEGIQAFSRALLAAGARSTLTTLWRVPDQPTAQFVRQFYFFLLEKHKSKAEALRLAKLEFLHSGTALGHPQYWAAFVLNGDGAEPVPRFLSWQLILLPLPVLVLLMVLYWYLRQRRRDKTAREGRSDGSLESSAKQTRAGFVAK